MPDVTLLRDDEADTATTIYAIGDVHGRLDLLDEMEMMVAAAIRQSRPEHPLICYLGDYIDRGPHSAQVIERLCSPFSDSVPRIFLKGNHEDRMIDFLDDPVGNGPSWIRFGGREALASYGVVAPADDLQTDWTNLRDGLDEALPDEHRRFLSELRLGLRWRDFLFVHAGLDPAKPDTDQSAHDMMWIREPFLNSERDWGFRVVHGHVISDEPVFRANRIGIDTGAYRSGRLTCLIASEKQLGILQTS